MNYTSKSIDIVDVIHVDTAKPRAEKDRREFSSNKTFFFYNCKTGKVFILDSPVYGKIVSRDASYYMVMLIDDDGFKRNVCFSKLEPTRYFEKGDYVTGCFVGGYSRRAVTEAVTSALAGIEESKKLRNLHAKKARLETQLRDVEREIAWELEASK